MQDYGQSTTKLAWIVKLNHRRGSQDILTRTHTRIYVYFGYIQPIHPFQRTSTTLIIIHVQVCLKSSLQLFSFGGCLKCVRVLEILLQVIILNSIGNVLTIYNQKHLELLTNQFTKLQLNDIVLIYVYLSPIIWFNR